MDYQELTRPLRRFEASSYLKDKHGISRSVKTLAKLAVIGGGPAFRKCNRTPLYQLEDLDSWVASLMSHRVSSTSEL